MDIFINDCLSLPEQVEKNRRDIIDIMNGSTVHNPFYRYNARLLIDNWREVNGYFWYTIPLEEITSESLCMVCPQRNSVMTPLFMDGYEKIRRIWSGNGDITIEARAVPQIDLDVSIFYNKDTEIID